MCSLFFLYWKSWNIYIFLYLVQGRIIWKSQQRFNFHHVSLCRQKQEPERTTTPQNPKQPTDLSLSFLRRRLTKTQQTAVCRLKLLHHLCTQHVSVFLWTGTPYQSDVGSLLDKQINPNDLLPAKSLRSVSLTSDLNWSVLKTINYILLLLVLPQIFSETKFDSIQNVQKDSEPDVVPCRFWTMKTEKSLYKLWEKEVWSDMNHPFLSQHVFRNLYLLL